jgi:hypothetical protein
VLGGVLAGLWTPTGNFALAAVLYAFVVAAALRLEESEDTPSLCCEFTEDGVVRIRGDFGHAVGTYPVTGGTRVRIHLSGHRQQDLPAWVRASILGDTLILEAPDGRQSKFRRG